MGILQKIQSAWKEWKSKSWDDEEETISGGIEIFSSLRPGWETAWSKTKRLQSYQKSLYVFRCVSKIAQKTASIDWNMFKIRNRVGDTIEVFVHEGLDLLYRPNAFQTKTEFFEIYMINKLLSGQSFVLKVRENGPGSDVKELWNLRPDKMTIVKDKEKFIRAFEFNKEDGRVVFQPEDIIYDSYPSPLEEYGGASILTAAETRVDIEEFATKYQRYFFQNNARPDFVLQSDTKITDAQKEEAKENWDKQHKGVLKVGKGAFLDRGLKYQQIAISQREMDYIESLKLTRDEILLAFAVPKPILGITDQVNYANAKTSIRRSHY